MKHTPGPWQVSSIGGKGFQIEGNINYSDDTSLELADVFGSSKSEAQANAHLIAAAPEMLKALEMALANLQEYAPVTMQTKDAATRLANLAHLSEVIKKARGES